MMNFGYVPFGWIFMILFWVLIIAGVVAFIKWISDQDKTESRKWDEATILFENLLPAFGGGRQPSEEEKKQYTFDAAEVKEIGFMLSLRLSDGSPNPKETFGEGIFPFSLVIQSMAMV